jgi:murein DD-endopeptidase MepM/ murein hydrolase activator NlpD
MSWRDIMHRVLPPIGGLSPEVTSPFGATKGRSPPSSIPYGGVDFNYPIGQTGINLEQPALRSPVAGIVTTNPGEGTFGRIAIRDANGLSHEILHTHTQYVKRGDLVGVGQPIGSMGNTGTKDQHVHYQLKDSAGHAINPTEFWDRLGSAKTDPGQPSYLDEYQQYLRGRDANAGTELGNALGAALASESAGQNASAPPDPAENIRRLGRRLSSVPPNDVPSPVQSNSFVGRFGNWNSSPAGSAPLSPPQPVTPPAVRSSRPAKFLRRPRRLDRRSGRYRPTESEPACAVAV